MIPRYTRPEMASIWDAQTRFKIWFEIEAHAADALAEFVEVRHLRQAGRERGDHQPQERPERIEQDEGRAAEGEQAAARPVCGCARHHEACFSTLRAR